MKKDIEDLERQTIITLEKLSCIFSELADEMNRSFYAIGHAVAILNEEYNREKRKEKYLRRYDRRKSRT